MIFQALVKSVWNGISRIKGNETRNTNHHLSIKYRDIANALTDIILVIVGKEENLDHKQFMLRYRTGPSL